MVWITALTVWGLTLKRPFLLYFYSISISIWTLGIMIKVKWRFTNLTSIACKWFPFNHFFDLIISTNSIFSAWLPSTAPGSYLQTFYTSYCIIVCIISMKLYDWNWKQGGLSRATLEISSRISYIYPIVFYIAKLSQAPAVLFSDPATTYPLHPPTTYPLQPTPPGKVYCQAQPSPSWMA